MSMHILPAEMKTGAKVATYLARAANARRSVQDGGWLNDGAAQAAKDRARERIVAARMARLSSASRDWWLPA